MPRLITTRIKQQLLILTTIFIRIRSKKRKHKKENSAIYMDLWWSQKWAFTVYAGYFN